MLQGLIQGHTERFGPPDGWDRKKDGPLPTLYVRKGKFGRHASLTSSFGPTIAEIDSIARGAPVHLTLLSNVQPPVRLTVGDTPDEWTPFPKAKRIISCASKGEPQAVVLEFPRPLTEQELERLKLFLTLDD